MPELHRDPQSTACPLVRAGLSGGRGLRIPHQGELREFAQAPVQRARVGGQGGRQLEQHRAKPVTEPGGRAQQARDGLGRITQPPDVGEVAAGLDGHDEALGRPGPPAGKGFPAWQSVEGAVVLDRGVLAGVVLQPAALRQAGSVEHTPPVAVLPAGGAD